MPSQTKTKAEAEAKAEAKVEQTKLLLLTIYRGWGVYMVVVYMKCEGDGGA